MLTACLRGLDLSSVFPTVIKIYFFHMLPRFVVTNSWIWIWLPCQHVTVTTLTIYVMLNWFAYDLQILLVDFNWFIVLNYCILLVDFNWFIVLNYCICIILNCGPYRQYGFCFIKASELMLYWVHLAMNRVQNHNFHIYSIQFEMVNHLWKNK
jgi:hypothetical protein